MKVLVANLGSTSFKFQLFEMSAGTEVLVAKGGYERVSDFRSVINDALGKLIADGHLLDIADLEAVGFKTVLGKDLSGCVFADDRTLKALDGMALIAPAHNPAYANGIRQFRELTEARLVALFETSFYQWMPESNKRYAVPAAWHEAGIRRNGFHGASHKFIAERSAQLLGRMDVAERVKRLYVDGPREEPTGLPLRVVSCHLGGSSSVTGIRNGIAMGTSMGLSPQSGLPQNNRVGDLDVMAVPMAMRVLGITEEEALAQLSQQAGLLGLSEVSNDLRDITAAAAGGDVNAAMAVDYLVDSIRHWIGALSFQMGGIDALVFTAGIGENQAQLRERVTAGLEDFGLMLDREQNVLASSGEREISAAGSRVKIWIIPANEETVVARETYRLLTASMKSE